MLPVQNRSIFNLLQLLSLFADLHLFWGLVYKAGCFIEGTARRRTVVGVFHTLGETLSPP